MVTVRDYNTLNHLKWALERIDTKEQDIVVMGSASVVRTLIAHDLVDEYRLLVFPAVLGKGRELRRGQRRTRWQWS